MVQLRKIEKRELRAARLMQKRGFMDVFLKYFDLCSPVFNSYQKFSGYFKKLDMYWIVYNHKSVGQIWIGAKGDTALLARIFVLKKFRNIGIAQQAIVLAEAVYPDCKRWRLDTIKEEKRNCHLYEKLGYTPSGAEHKINKRMTIMDYGKFMGD